MKLLKLIPFIALAALAGCTGLPMLTGGVTIYTSPEAGAMRACAALTDVVTPGVSPLAMLELVKGAMGAGTVLGDSPAEALENCSGMIRALE